jgi:LysM repeat protein
MARLPGRVLSSLRSLRGRLPYLVAALGVLAAAWATVLNLGAVQAGEPAADPTPLPAVPTDEAIVLPAYAVESEGSGITRQVVLDTKIPARARVVVLRYTVQSGDSIFGIAKKFDLTPETVLWGNFEALNDDPHSIAPGIELNILPVDGTYYEWKDGDDLAAVASSFDADPQAILDWPGNNLDPTNLAIEPGTWLIVPGGKRELKTWVVPTVARSNAGVGTAFGPGGCSGDFSSGAVGTGAFIWPSANHYLSGNEYWSGHLAIDIAAGLGDPVWAADSGVVVYAGWSNGGYGNMVMIDHGNGYQTVYAHLNSVKTSCGSSISQGSVLGGAGSTGNSTGVHLHFEIRSQGGFINPWYVLP